MKKSQSINKNKRNSIIIIAVFALLGISLLIYSKAATPTTSSPGGVVSLAAGQAAYTLSPSSGTYKSGTDFTVSIFENSGTVPTAGVDAFLTYDATKLDFIGANTTGGVFTDCYGSTPSGGSGSVKFSCVKNGSTFTGNQKIGNVTFRPKVGSGTTAVTFASNSEIYDETVSNIWNGDVTGGSFTLGSTTTTTPPTGGGGGGTTTPPTTSPSSGGSSAPNTGSSGGSTPKPSSGGSSTPSTGSTGGSSSNPSTTPTTDPAAGGSTVPSDTTATATTTTASKLNTNAIIMYAGIIGGIVIIASVSGTAFVRIKNKNKFNKAHGLGSNTAVVFDTNKAPSASVGVDQGAIVTPQAAAPTAPASSPKADAKGPEGSIITPNGPTAPPSA